MNSLINIDVSLYFEISNSEIFGGEGSVGYTSVTLRSVENIDNVDDSFIQNIRLKLSKDCNVNLKDVKQISKEEYDKETDDGEDNEEDK